MANSLNLFRNGAVGFIEWLNAVGLGFIFGGATGMDICYKLQLDTVLKKCLKTRKREREPLSRVGDVTEKLVAIACPAGLPDREERCIVSMRREPAPQTVLRAVFRRIGVVGNKTATSTYSPSKSLASGQRLWVDPRWAHSSLVTSDV